MSEKPSTSIGGPVSSETLFMLPSHPNENANGKPVEQVTLVIPSHSRPWWACKFCGQPEDGPHKEDCPGDTVAMLLRVQDLEREVRRLKAMLEGGK